MRVDWRTCFLRWKMHPYRSRFRHFWLPGRCGAKIPSIIPQNPPMKKFFHGLALAGLTLAIVQATSVAAPKIGVFPRINDGGGKAHVDTYEAWLGRPVDHIVQFTPGDTWSHISGASLDWWIGQWDNYPQSYRDRMVISLSMLPSTNDGSTLALGAAGNYNSHWTTVATKLVAAGYGNCVLRPGWEFNGNWYRWSAIGKATEFKNYWIQLVTTMRAVPGANFTFCWNPTVGDSGMNPMTAYPGSAYVDQIGLDVYDIYSGYATAGYPDSMPAWQVTSIRNNGWLSTKEWGNYHLEWWKAQAATAGKPLCIPEWGLDNPIGGWLGGKGGRDNTIFLQNFKNWMYNPANNVAWASYFEVGYGTSDRNHAICFANQYPNAKALFPTLFGYMLDETFEDSVANGFTPNLPAQWTIVTDSGDKAYKFDFNWTNQSGTSTAGVATWSNYSVLVDFKITDLQSWSETHLYARRTDGNNTYDVMVQDQGGTRKVILRKKVGGTTTNLGSATVSVAANTWYTLGFSLSGSALAVSFNGAQIISTTDTALTAGGIALGAWKQDVLFDNVLVQ